jgi:hypothetical protein
MSRRDVILNPGQVVEFDSIPFSIPKSVVVSVEFMHVHNQQGKRHRWKRWALQQISTDVPQINEQWYMVNVPGLGAHFCRAAEPRKPNHEPDTGLSGRLEVKCEGDEDVGILRARRHGHIATYPMTNGGFFMVETYEAGRVGENSQQLYFEAFPYESN